MTYSVQALYLSFSLFVFVIHIYMDKEEGLETSTSLIYLYFYNHNSHVLASADRVPFLVAQNDTAENCYAYNSSSLADDALPPSCVDGCCCVAVNLTCPCNLDPFYICRNGSYLDVREPCDCPTDLCICIRNSTVQVNNTRLYYERTQSCCGSTADSQEARCDRQGAGCTSLSKIRKMVVGGKM